MNGSVPPELGKAPLLILEGYEVDVDTLTDPQKAVLARFVQKVLVWLSHRSSTEVVLAIDGHTDATGTELYNAGLGLRRAENVERQLRLLVGGGSVARRVRYRSRSLGLTNPRQPNRTRAGRARNRRVEVRTAWLPIPAPPRRRPAKPPPLVRTPVIEAGPCIELHELLRTPFKQALDSWGHLMASAKLVWPGEGFPLTLAVTRSELAEVFSADLLDRLVGELQGAAVPGNLKLGLNLDLAQSALELFGQLGRDATNREIMREASDTRREDRRSKLVWRMVAEQVARNDPGRRNPIAWYIHLWQQAQRWERLEAACAETRRRQLATIGLPSPHARPGQS